MVTYYKRLVSMKSNIFPIVCWSKLSQEKLKTIISGRKKPLRKLLIISEIVLILNTILIFPGSNKNTLKITDIFKSKCNYWS